MLDLKMITLFSLIIFIITLRQGSSNEIADSVNQIYFSNFAGKDKHFAGSPIGPVTILPSVLRCAAMCQQVQQCKAVNVMDAPTGKKCELLGNIPMNPDSVQNFNGSQYWEKTCQPLFGLVAADSNSIRLENTVYADNGKNIYTVEFSSTFQVDEVLYGGPAAPIPGAPGGSVINSAVVRSNTFEIKLFMMQEQGNVYCSNLSFCPGTWPKSLTELWPNPYPVWAMLPTANKSTPGLYLFNYDKYTHLSVDETGDWTFQSTYMLGDQAPGNIFKGAPKGIIAASWIVETTGTNPKHAFLATRDYIVVFDTVLRNIVSRGHVCKP